MVLEGLAASWDEMLGGALMDLLKESQKEFQNGAVALIGLRKSKEESSDVSLVTKLCGSIVFKCTEENRQERQGPRGTFE